MQNNYNNPSSLYPQAGSTSVLEGWNYPERMADYRRMFEQSALGGDLQNQRTQAENEDYYLGGDVRALERGVKRGSLGSELALQPQKHRLAHSVLEGQNEVQPFINKYQTWMAQNQLPQAEHAQHMGKLAEMSKFLRTVPDKDWESADPTAILDTLNRTKLFDLNHWKGQDPQAVKRDLNQIRGLDETFYKEAEKYRQLYFEQAQANGRNSEHMETLRYIANLNKDRKTSNLTKAEKDQADDEKMVEILTKRYRKKKFSEEDARDRAIYDVWQVRARDPFNQAGARTLQESEAVKRIMSLFDSEQEVSPVTTEKPIQEEVSSKPTKEEQQIYDSTPVGGEYIYRGKKYTKGRK